MNTLEIFKNTEFGLLDTVLIDDRVFFLGKQVALILQYANPSEAVADHVDKEDCIVLKYKAYSKTIDGLWTGNDFSDKVLINESGLYSLILRSNMPKAREFKRWVTSEVLPSIRKTGSYNMPDFSNPAEAARAWADAYEARQRAELALVESNKQLEAAKEENKVAIDTIKEAKPCVEFYSQYQESDGFLVRELSKFLELFGIIISRKNLYGYLAYIGFIFKKDPENGRWEPYASAQKQGFIYYASDKGDEFFKANPKSVKITVKGINFLINSIRRNEKIFLGFGSLKPNFDSRVNASDILNKIRTFVENHYAY